MTRAYGCIPDLVSHDRSFAATRPQSIFSELVLPKEYRLEAVPPVMNQLSEGSCVAHAITAAMRYNWLNNDLPDIPLSRNQLYFDTRRLEGTIPVDAGCQIRNAITVGKTIGVATETAWSYDLTTWANPPPLEAYQHVSKITEAARVDVDVTEIKTAIFTGKPVVCGISVFTSFESDAVAASGVVPMPSHNDKLISGHAMLCVGYEPGWFVMMNSWGEDWGDKGFCRIPEAYLGSSGYGADYWVIYGEGDLT